MEITIVATIFSLWLTHSSREFPEKSLKYYTEPYRVKPVLRRTQMSNRNKESLI